MTSKTFGALASRTLLFVLASVPVAPAWGQSRNNDPRSPGGRYLSPSDESPPLVSAGLDQFVEGENLAREEAWLAGQYRDLRRKMEDVNRQRENLRRRKAAWRCSAGLTVEACFANPPVHPEALAFRAWYNTEIDRLDGVVRNVRASKQRLDDLRSSYDARRRSHERRLKAARKPGEKGPRRSPDEGLFIDESAPRRR